MEIDLTTMPSGKTYEDRYGKYLDVFKQVYEGSGVVVISPPACWVPLIWWLGGRIEGDTQRIFEQDDIYETLLVTGAINRNRILYDRTLLETLTGVRPELVDALWKSDCEWFSNTAPVREREKEFVVTNNGSFHRPEIFTYQEMLRDFVPSKKKCILVPCAADKPYPAKLHKAVLKIMPVDYHLIIATGVLGLVPMELWDKMPHYDSGIPNEWRLMKTVASYFGRHDYHKIVVYCDFYNEALSHGLQGIHTEKVFVNPIKFYFNYLDLLDKNRLARLRESLYK